MSNLFFTGRGVRTKLNIPFNLQYKKKNSHLDLQLFANNKLISLDRMRDFLSECKNIFYMESDLANENEINGIVEDQLIPKPVDLSYYARDNIQDYTFITQIPQDNLDYLNSGLVASDMSNMFYDCNNLQSIPKLNIDTSQCVNMYGMFDYCYALTTIDLSNFDTSNVTDMSSMFRYCYALTTIDLSNWDTSNVTDMKYMFYGCRNLEHIEGIIDMKSCTKTINYSYMFYNCTKLSGVKIKNPPDNFESTTKLSSSQYEIVS